MRSIYKKSAIALVVLGFAGITYASTVNGLFLGFEGMDLQPRNGDLDFATVYPNFITGDINTHSIRPSYHWGWRLFGGVKFCGNDDAALSWERFHTNSNGSIGTPKGLIPPALGISQPRWLEREDTWRNINSNVTFNLDDVYGAFGHTFNMNAWNFRLAGGVEWARVNSDMRTNAAMFTSNGLTGFGYKADSHLNGAGPRLEADMAFNLPFGASVFATGNAALLISSRTVSLNTLNVNLGEFRSVSFTDRLVMVPKFGMRLGAAYSYTFGQVGGEGATGMLTTVSVAGGWQLESYIHAIERPVPGVLSGTYGEENLLTKVSNFGDQGFFVGIRAATDWV